MYNGKLGSNEQTNRYTSKMNFSKLKQVSGKVEEDFTQYHFIQP